jgi:17beta-estradiol 17-dehydrogenase / very-long-chain 3-oxoacyl-CoA reductase
MFVQTKMNDYSTSVMKGNILVPDVESYTKSAVFTLGKSSRTTGYWSHGIQYVAMQLVPEFVRTSFCYWMNKKFRKEYHEALKQVTVGEINKGMETIQTY